MHNKPIFVFTGLLDSGKSSAIISNLDDKEFNNEGKNLIISFEQGDVEFDDDFLKRSNSKVVYLDSLEEFSYQRMADLDYEYNPDRIFIELNGTFDDKDFYNRQFINNWIVAQVLCFVDGTTFNLFMENMKQFMFNHISSSDVVVINRSDDVDKRYIRNNLKAINKGVQIVFEDSEGNMSNGIDDSMFDTSKPLNILDDDYGLWYMDALDNPHKYNGVEITVRLKAQEDVKTYNGVYCFGRNAMVCCANDIQGINVTCINVDKKKVKLNNFYYIHGFIKIMKDDQGNDTCVIDVKDIKPSEPMEDELVYFN